MQKQTLVRISSLLSLLEEGAHTQTIQKVKLNLKKRKHFWPDSKVNFPKTNSSPVPEAVIHNHLIQNLQWFLLAFLLFSLQKLVFCNSAS